MGRRLTVIRSPWARPGEESCGQWKSVRASSSVSVGPDGETMPSARWAGLPQPQIALVSR